MYENIVLALMGFAFFHIYSSETNVNLKTLFFWIGFGMFFIAFLGIETSITTGIITFAMILTFLITLKELIQNKGD